MIIVSKCLLGECCKYNGGHNYRKHIVEYLKDKDYIAVCPEQAGGLSTPRDPCECFNDRVINCKGEDKTLNFINGAWSCLEEARQYDIEAAILKSKSPSCGKGSIYDGSFNHRLIEGDGIFVRLLKQHHIPVYTDEEINMEEYNHE